METWIGSAGRLVAALTMVGQQVQGRSPIEAGVRLLPLTAVFMVASPLGGAVAGRLGARWTLVVGMLLNAVAQFGMSRLGADSPYSHLWPWFAVLGFGFAFVVVAGTQAIISNAPVELAGTAGGLQQTGAQLGGVLGITVLGTIMAARVSDVLVGKLTSAGVPMPLANQLADARDVVAQGGAPAPPGVPDSVAHAITIGSHLAFMGGLRTALIVAPSPSSARATTAGTYATCSPPCSRRSATPRAPSQRSRDSATPTFRLYGGQSKTSR